MIRTATWNPSFAPSTKLSYTGTRLYSPYSGNPTSMSGMTKKEIRFIALRMVSMAASGVWRRGRGRRVPVGVGVAVHAETAEQLGGHDGDDERQHRGDGDGEDELVDLQAQERQQQHRRHELHAGGIDGEQHDHRVGGGVLGGIERLQRLHRLYS